MTDPNLQFDHADHAAPASGASCTFCKQPIAATYFEINGRVACARCRGQIMAAWNRGSPGKRFATALGLGAVAAALGAGLYFGIEAVQARVDSTPSLATAAAGAAARPDSASRPRKAPGFLAFGLGLAVLLALAYAAPIMIGVSSPLHLVIAGIALYEAWKLNRGAVLRVTGPYQTAAPSAPA